MECLSSTGGLKMRLLENRWYDEDNNSWSADTNTEEQALEKSNTLTNCRDCMDSSYCSRCSGCSDCSGCSRCSGCSGCSDCSDCSGCSGCSRCSYGSDCSYCSGFNENPQRITSAKIGSRGGNTTVYYVDGQDAQVVCGCFRGNLEKFEAKVVATHGENEHAIAYLAWIGRVRAYFGIKKEGE